MNSLIVSGQKSVRVNQARSIMVRTWRSPLRAAFAPPTEAGPVAGSCRIQTAATDGEGVELRLEGLQVEQEAEHTGVGRPSRHAGR